MRSTQAEDGEAAEEEDARIAPHPSATQSSWAPSPIQKRATRAKKKRWRGSRWPRFQDGRGFKMAAVTSHSKLLGQGR